MSLIFIPGQELLSAHVNALASCSGVNVSPSGTTTSSSFANIGGSTSVSFTKVDASSRLRVDLHVSCFVTGSVPDVAEFGVLINGTDYAIMKGTISAASIHKTFSGIRLIGGIAAGTYTVQARWRRVSGSGTVTGDGDDRLSFAVMEVQE